MMRIATRQVPNPCFFSLYSVLADGTRINIGKQRSVYRLDIHVVDEDINNGDVSLEKSMF